VSCLLIRSTTPHTGRVGEEQSPVLHRADEAWRPYVILRHRLGDDPSQDVEVLTESDERYWLRGRRSRDDRWIIGAEVRSPRNSGCSAPMIPRVSLVSSRHDGRGLSTTSTAGDRLLIVHNDGAEDFELQRRRSTPPVTPSGGRSFRTATVSGSCQSARTPAMPSSRCDGMG
jgi:protease II